MSKYSVNFTAECDVPVSIDECYDIEDALDSAVICVQDADYGKTSVIADLTENIDYDTLYDDYGYDEDDGCGEGTHEVVVGFELEVEADSAEEALQAADDRLNAILHDSEMKSEKNELFGDLSFSSLQSSPTLDNVQQIEQEYENGR